MVGNWELNYSSEPFHALRMQTPELFFKKPMKVLIYKETDIPNFAIVGSIDENADFSVFEANHNDIHVDCSQIYRINSTGVRKWMKLFETVKKKGVKVFYYQVSTALIEQFNSIRNFGMGGHVMSAVLPFICKKCMRMRLIVKTKAEVDQIDLSTFQIPCEHCGQNTLQFDDDAREYLHFWQINK